MMKALKTISMSSAALLFVACGGGGPDTDQVRADFDNPSGDVSDESGVKTAVANQNASGPAAELGGNPMAFVGGGSGLTASKNATSWKRIHSARILRNHINSIIAHGDVEFATRQFSQTSLDADISNCIDPTQVSASGNSVSFEMNLSCVSGFSGSMKITGEGKQDGDNIDYKISAEYNKVCYMDECIDGKMDTEMSLNLANLAAAQANFISAWNFTISGPWGEANTKGGVRAKANSTSGELEFVVYGIDSAGNEVSFVYSYSISSDAEMASIKGQNGTLNCSTAGGTWMCTGNGEFTFTPEDIDAALAGLQL